MSVHFPFLGVMSIDPVMPTLPNIISYNYHLFLVITGLAECQYCLLVAAVKLLDAKANVYILLGVYFLITDKQPELQKTNITGPHGGLTTG